VDVEVDNQHAFDKPFGKQQQGGDADIVEGAEAGALVSARVMAATRSVAGDAVLERQPGGEHRAGGRQLRAARHPRVDGKADFSLDSVRHGAGQHLLDIGGQMRPVQPFRIGRSRHLDGAAQHVARRQAFHQKRIFAHRKAMGRRQFGVIVGMVGDRQLHGRYLAVWDNGLGSPRRSPAGV
jgi:hypothetical protein